VRVRNVLTAVTEVPTRNEGDGFCDKVTYHWQVQIFLKILVAGEKIHRCISTPIVYTPTDFCLVKLPGLLHEFYVPCHGENKS
jgi:hypothetical protein